MNEIGKELERLRRSEPRNTLKDHVDTIKYEWREIVPIFLIFVGAIVFTTIF